MVDSQDALSTNPKDYMWSGGVGSTYKYSVIVIQTDSTGRDSIRYGSERFTILNLDTIIGKYHCRKVSYNSYLERLGVSGTRCYVTNDTMFSEILTDTSFENILVAPLKVNSSYMGLDTNDISTVKAIDEKITTPAGTFRTIKVQQRNTTINYQYVTDYWYALGTGFVQYTITSFPSVHSSSRYTKSVRTVTLQTITKN
jgi:hypothetical protein